MRCLVSITCLIGLAALAGCGKGSLKTCQGKKTLNGDKTNLTRVERTLLAKKAARDAESYAYFLFRAAVQLRTTVMGLGGASPV